MERIITKSFARLMGRGVHRGFITFEELKKSLGKRNLSNPNLEQAFIHILNEKVTLVEKKSDFKVLRKKDSSSKEEGKAIEKSDLYPYGASVGDQKLPSKSKYVNHTDEDDVSSPEIRLNTYIKFYSSEYGAIYVSKIVTSVKKHNPIFTGIKLDICV